MAAWLSGQKTTVDGEALWALLKEHSPFEIYESRLELEPNLAALAAGRATPEEKREIRGRLEILIRLGRELGREPDRLAEYAEKDRRLHLQIGRCAYNGVLFRLLAAICRMAGEKHRRVLEDKGALTGETLRRHERERAGIVRAVCEGKAEIARSTMRRHLREGRKELFDGEPG